MCTRPFFWEWDLGIRLPLAGQKSRSLESVKDTKIKWQTKRFLRNPYIYKSMRLEHHKEPYNTAPWTRKRNM